MSSLEKKVLANQLEFWLLHPFNSPKDIELPVIGKITELIQSFQEGGGDEVLGEIRILFEENKQKYNYVERKQIEKAMDKMASSVLSKIISDSILPAAKKVADVVSPKAKKVWDETLVPASDKTLRFLTKTFVKKRVKVVEENDGT